MPTAATESTSAAHADKDRSFEHDFHSREEKNHKWMLEERQHMSEENTKQRAAWERRRTAGKMHTEAEPVGHFAAQTVASNHHSENTATIHICYHWRHTLH